MKPKIGGKHFQFQIPFDSVSFLRLPLISLVHEFVYVCSMLYVHKYRHALVHNIQAAFVAQFFYTSTLFASYFLNGSSATLFTIWKAHTLTHWCRLIMCDVNHWKSTKQIKIFIFMMIIIIIIMNLVDSKISVCHEAFELIVVCILYSDLNAYQSSSNNSTITQ